MVIRRTFLRFLNGYILLLLVPLSFGTLLTRNLVAEVEEKIVEARIDQLEQARDIITRFVEDLEWRVYQIAGDTALNRFLMGTDDGDRRLLLKEVVDNLKSVLLYDSSLVSVFYIHAFEENTILTPNSAYNAGDFVDGKTYFRMDGTSTLNWHREVRSQYHEGRFYPARPVTFEDFKNKSMIPYVRSLPLAFDGRTEDQNAVIVYFIGDEEFSGLLRHIALPEGGFAYIADEENRILSSRSASVEAQAVTLPGDHLSGSFRLAAEKHDDAFVTYVKSEDTGWSYVSVLPVPWVFQSVRIMQTLSYGALFLALILSVGISAVISWKRSEILGNLFGLLGENGPETRQRDYQDLNTGVTRLVRTNDEMKEELLRQKQFVFGNFVNRLLNGYYRNEEILSKYREYLGLTGESRRFSAVALALSEKGDAGSVFDVHELAALKGAIITELQNRFSGTLWTYEPEEDLIACIFQSDSTDDEAHHRSVHEALTRWLDTRPSQASHGLHIGTGDTVGSLLEIHRSWIQAREAGDYASREGEAISCFADIERELDSAYYPIELEVRLLNAVRAGDAETLRDVFGILRAENLENRTLPGHEADALLNEVRSTLMKAENRLGRGDRKDIPSPDNPGEGLSDYEERFLVICDQVNRNKRSHNSDLIRRIRQYLDDNYADRNLCLSAVAAEFSISESYLSYFFKEQTGEKFSARIESIRIGKAESLLRDTGLSISEVAGQVGYNSDKTFRRVFRRIKGMSPNEYRQDIKLNRIL